MKCFEIRVEGIVQGVGFRPYIFRIASDMKLNGFVRNDTEGVFIKICAEKKAAEQFIEEIKSNPPPLSIINNIGLKESHEEKFDTFEVAQSRITKKREAFIPPDTALCQNCHKELLDPSDRRFHFPYTTCTHCGPRFSIISDIPYDRKNTAMKPFPMCRDCKNEYEDPFDRRFHTEPTSCPACGPKYFFKNKNGDILSDNISDIIEMTENSIKSGLIVAIKGVGGFHLAADAKNSEVVRKLRERKRRPFKPFAVMAGSIEYASEFLKISEKEREILLSKERPIVILQEKNRVVSELVAPGLTHMGVMIPYSPLQILLFEKMDDDKILIMTSGNISDEPIIYDEENLFENLGSIADVFVTSNRKIVQQSDDSVIFVVDEKPFFMRRSRGFVPAPLFSDRNDSKFFAAGADLKNSFALSKDDKIILSQYIGDLESPLTEKVFIRTVDHFKKIFDIDPDITVSDMHPNYFSSAIAEKLGEGKKRFKVQHHHAHIASVLDEHNFDEKVLGLAFDGTGYGTDGNIWGSEILVSDRREFVRRGHLDYFMLPGGEQAIKDVWKIGYSLLYKTFGRDSHLTDKSREYIFEIMEKEINSPLCCSVGRLFDGISSILGISDSVSTEAEAAMLLEERALKRKTESSFTVGIEKKGIEYIFKTVDFVKGVLDMTGSGHSVEDAAYAFHNSLVISTIEVLKNLRDKTGLNNVVLSGGVFQNRILLNLFLEKLGSDNFRVMLPAKVPLNDGCIALGQISVAKKHFRI